MEIDFFTGRFIKKTGLKSNKVLIAIENTYDLLYTQTQMEMLYFFLDLIMGKYKIYNSCERKYMEVREHENP